MNIISPKPVQSYTAPSIPTLEQTCNSSDFLKKLPLRWRKCAAVCTAVGLIGGGVLTGLTGCNNDPHRFHHGGSGGAPVYIVYFTEQEALAIIRTSLEEAGLEFSEDYSGDYDLFDEERSVGVKFYEDKHYYEIKEGYKIRDDGVAFGKFYSWGEYTNLCELCKPTEEEKSLAKIAKAPFIEENLEKQAQDFVDFLKEKEIL